MLDEQERVILVDESDQTLDAGPKLGTHESGLLHRAISVFVFNGRGDLLLQQRADCKYHSAGKWANTCCGHPRPDETCQAAAERRLFEEMGMSVDLRFGFKSRYEAQLDNNMIENEIPYLYFGQTDAVPEANPGEVQAYKYLPLDKLRQEIDSNPEQFSVWLIHYMDSHENRLSSLNDMLLSERWSTQSDASSVA
ncbi:MAG: isopentenyl-diphosphate Delta-isomerase [Pseudomonadota bacterium]